MPWKAFKEGDQWCVYKLGADGEKTGKSLKCHESKTEASDHVKALYANVKEFAFNTPNAALVAEYGDSLDDFTMNVRAAFEKEFMPRDPDIYIDMWVTDVFPDHVVVRRDQQYFRVDFTANPDKTFEFAPRDEWQRVNLAYVVAEMAPITSTLVSQFAGKTPEIPIADGVDMTALLEGDDDPLFLKLPVARRGEVSKTGMVHSDAYVKTLVRQINEKRPGGILGHIPAEERGSSYPVPDVHWLGAVEDETGTVWAKGLIPKSKPQVRENFRIEKAKNGKVSTSVYGLAEHLPIGGGHWLPENFNLEQLDLAPFDRAAWPGDGRFEITKQMTGTAGNRPDPEPEDDNMPDKVQVIAELTPADLPEKLRQQVIAEFESSAVETATAPLLEENTTLKARVTELEQTIADFTTAEEERKAKEAAAAFDAALDSAVAEMTPWNVTTEVGKKLVAQFRGTVKTAVIEHIGDEKDLEKVPTVVSELWDSEFGPLAPSYLAMIGGGAAAVGGTGKPAPIEVTPEREREARATVGI